MAEEIKLKGLSITEADREFTKDFPKLGSFTIRIPLPYEKARIISNTSRFLNGSSLESIQVRDYEFIRMLSTLDYVVVKHPEWWQSASDCANENFLEELWKFFVDCERKFDEFLKKNL